MLFGFPPKQPKKIEKDIFKGGATRTRVLPRGERNLSFELYEQEKPTQKMFLKEIT